MTVDPKNAHSDSQKKVLDLIIEDGKCPFCLENLERYHPLPVEKRRFWAVTRNQWPYKNTEDHFLLILLRCETEVEKLLSEEWLELFLILRSLIKDQDIPGGAFGMRFGETLFSGGTVNHLHAQIIVPDVESKDYEPVKFYVGGQK